MTNKKRPNIFLIGFMGSGKSYWGRVWSEFYHLPFIDLDEEIEKSSGMKISDMFSTFGEEKFRQKERELLLETIKHEGSIIACGGGTPCFFQNMEWMLENGVVIYLKATPEYIYKRIESEADKRPLLHRLTGDRLISYIADKIDERSVYYERASYIRNVENITSGWLADILSTPQFSSGIKKQNK